MSVRDLFRHTLVPERLSAARSPLRVAAARCDRARRLRVYRRLLRLFHAIRIWQPAAEGWAIYVALEDVGIRVTSPYVPRTCSAAASEMTERW